MHWMWWIAGGFGAWLLLEWRFKRASATFGSAGWLSLWKAYRRGLFRG